MNRPGETYLNAVVDPPALARGGGAERAPAAGLGGGTGTTHLATTWDVITLQDASLLVTQLLSRLR